MNITVHRGSNEIGGTCIEVEKSGFRIIMDLGIPLTKSGGGEFDQKDLKKATIANELLPDVKGIYADGEPTVDAVLLSHAHLDHYGLMDHIHTDIPVYLSEDAKTIIEVGNIFWRKEMQQKILLTHCKTFKYWNSFELGPFRITPYLVDHSAYGACAFLVESDGKKLFYTGDFRAHGNKAKTYYKLLKDEKLKGADALIIEGTTLGGGHKGSLANEDDVKKRMTDIFKAQRDVTFVMAAGSNIDRLISLFKAARSAKKELVIDLYQYYLLSRLQSVTEKSGLPPFKDDNLRILYMGAQTEKIAKNLGPGLLYKYKTKKINRDEIIKNRQNLVIRLSILEMKKLAEEMEKQSPLKDTNFIYSMWTGYLNRNKEFYDFRNKYNLKMINIHSSGHAYKKDLLRLIDAIHPKTIIPVHTLNADIFQKEVEHINVVRDKQVSL